MPHCNYLQFSKCSHNPLASIHYVFVIYYNTQKNVYITPYLYLYNYSYVTNKYIELIPEFMETKSNGNSS
jgi:hypothetical protein